MIFTNRFFIWDFGTCVQCSRQTLQKVTVGESVSLAYLPASPARRRAVSTVEGITSTYPHHLHEGVLWVLWKESRAPTRITCTKACCEYCGKNHVYLPASPARRRAVSTVESWTVTGRCFRWRRLSAGRRWSTTTASAASGPTSASEIRHNTVQQNAMLSYL